MNHSSSSEPARSPDNPPVGAQTDRPVVEDAGYRKALSNRHIQMIAIGGAIGSGLFLGAGGRLESAGPALILVYAVAGVAAFMVVRAMGEMVMHRPASGSFVSYSREFIGEPAAYLAGWLYFLNWACSGMGDITAAAVYVKFFAPDVPQWIPALIALAVVLSVNLASVRIFGELEFWFAAVKVAALLIFMVIAIYVLVSRNPVDGVVTGPQLIVENGGFFPAGFLAVLMILQGVVFAYAGVEMVGVTAGETKNPHQVIPRAVNSLGWRIAVFYVGSILLLCLLLPTSMYQSGESPFVTVLDRVGVPGAAGVMSIVVLTAALSSVNSGLYSTGRILRSLAFNGSAPKILGRMSGSGVPYTGVLLTASVYVLGVVLNYVLPEDAFEIVTGFSALGVIGMWSMIMISHLAMVRASAQGRLERPTFRLPGAPYTNYVVLAFLLLVLVMTWFNGDTGRLIVFGAPVIAAALWVGWLACRRRVAEIRDRQTAEPAPQ